MRNYILIFLLFFGALSYAQEQKIHDLKFEGLKRTKESFLRRLVKIRTAEAYDTILINEDIERLKRLPGIANATFSMQKTEEGIDVVYKIEENFTIIPGLRISNDVNGDFAFRLSVFEFNLLGNNQLIGGFYERNVFDSYGIFWEHPFLFSDKLGIGFNYQDRTTQEPVFFEAGTENYRFNSKNIEGALLFSFDFNNEAELGVSLVKEEYDFLGESNTNPSFLTADKLIYRGQYRFVDLDIDYQYFDGVINEFTAQYIDLLDGDALGNQFLKSFLSLRNDAILYKKIGQKGNWASRLRLAATFGNEESPFAPFTLDNQLNIRGVGDTVDRGIAAAVLNTEYRHTLYEKGWFVFQGNAFLDTGTWRNPGEGFSDLFNSSNIRVYPGLGVRFIHKRIFNAVFRLDYGFGLGDNATNGIVFGIGQYF
ncbi:MAG: POTRA domain-containing protein [Allomuricauda sp.]